MADIPSAVFFSADYFFFESEVLLLTRRNEVSEKWGMVNWRKISE